MEKKLHHVEEYLNPKEAAEILEIPEEEVGEYLQKEWLDTNSIGHRLEDFWTAGRDNRTLYRKSLVESVKVKLASFV